MCGIFGWIISSERSIDYIEALSADLILNLSHRGPDDNGWAIFSPDGHLISTNQLSKTNNYKNSLLIGQTRLSIIDLSITGHQPMFSPDKRYSLIYNGEIYNYRELKGLLKDEGVQFVGNSDTEVLLHALIRWGQDCLSRLTGMFAFAFYDAAEHSLFLARDCFGIKPLYWHNGPEGFAFASDVPALLRFPGVSRRLSPQTVYDYLCFGQYGKGGASFFQDIFQLPPAHCLTVNTQTKAVSEPKAYWRPDLSVRSPLSFSDAAECLRAIFLDSVRLHLRSDVPLGVALSGGIDSSAVACALRHLDKDAEIHTFSFIAKNSPVSEESWAALAASHVGAVRHTVEVAPQELVEDLDEMILRQGEPFGSTSIYAQYRVFRLARDCGVKVTLDGQGADELLAGYFGYPGPRLASLLLRGNFIKAWRFLRAKSAWPGVSVRETLKRAAREFTPQWLVPLALRLAGRDPAPAWLDVEALKEAGASVGLHDDKQRLFPGGRDKVRQTLAYALTWDGLQSLLRHGDRNSMAFSVESRVPFLTRHMADFCLSLPEDYLIDMNGRTKSVFRQAMRSIVPDAILDRRDKIGFATPEREWLSVLTHWVETVLANSSNIPFLRHEATKIEWIAICDGKKEFDWRVWRWINYIRWVQLLQINSI
jgi:asparagine synthase (glutamine-hydrolysing)